MVKLFLVLGLLLEVGLSRQVFAGGLSTSFGDVLIENLQIGETYSTKELINLPLRVQNNSAYEMDLKVEVMIPGKQDIKEGFEPIPSPFWIRFECSTFTVKPGGTAETDVFISIPKDKNLKGKQFQVYLHSYTIPKPEKSLHISVGLASRLLFTIAEIEVPRKKGDEPGVFQVQPDNLFLIDVPVGEKVDVWKRFSKCLEVYNPNKIQCQYRIESITLKEGDSPIRKGFEETPNPKYLTFAADQVAPYHIIKVPPKSFERVSLYLNIPNKPEMKEKNFMFLVRVKQLTGATRVAVNSRVYVMTK